MNTQAAETSIARPGCAGCGSPDIEQILSLGRMPPVNAFVTEDEAAREKAFPLDLLYCSSCTLVQLKEVPDPKELFVNYLHLSSASRSNVEHLREVAELLRSFVPSPTARVLEIGSNDGTLLGFVRSWAGEVLGVDPASNLAPVARESGVETLSSFFDHETGKEIAESRGQFDAVVALNVVAHTPRFVSLLAGVREVLRPDGVFVMEAAYALETILKGQFDTIYHEHVYCFSLHALSAAFKKVGLRIVHAEVIATQGCSLRVVGAIERPDVVEDPSVAKLLKLERDCGFTDCRTFQGLEVRAQAYRGELRSALGKLRQEHSHLIGLGAPARGVVVLNYADIGPALLDFIIDDTSLKVGKLTPGTHVPVRRWDELGRLPVGATPAFFLLSWNYRQEIFGKLRAWVPNATILSPFPRLEVVQCGPG